MTLDTPMFLASAGKMFTGVAVLQLVDAGKIDLDAPLGKYLADYPNKDVATATIRQLLTHRGGTGDIGILGREDGANRARVRTIDDIVQLNGTRGPEFPPGAKADYSNFGFILLGAVIEKVTSGSYYDYVREHVFKPAGMKNAGFPDRDHLQGVAVGYTTFFGAQTQLVPNLDVLPWRGASAGGGVASANDMLRFFDALKAGKLLSAAMLKLATTPGDTPWYGMGFVAQGGEHPSWGHGGTSYGMDVAFHTYSENDTTFICMATRDAVCNRLIFAHYFRTFGPFK
jgi:CubicO group peptidase (beta-lactamase class C family)